MQPAADASAARWIIESLDRQDADGLRVASLMPAIFPRYARVLHPAKRPDGNIAKWREIASQTGRELAPDSTFRQITVPVGMPIPEGPLGAWPSDGAPSDGSLPLEQLSHLASVLSRFTEDPDHCFFAVWIGYGYRAIEGDGDAFAPTFRTNAVEYYLWEGTLADIRDATGWIEYHPPNLWWPQDQAWVVASEIDDFSTYVGGSQNCIRSVLLDEVLEVHPTTPEAYVVRTNEWLA